MKREEEEAVKKRAYEAAQYAERDRVLSAAVAAVTSVGEAASSVFCFEVTELLGSFLDALVEADRRARADLKSGTIPLPPAGVDDVIRLLSASNCTGSAAAAAFVGPGWAHPSGTISCGVGSCSALSPANLVWVSRRVR